MRPYTLHVCLLYIYLCVCVCVCVGLCVCVCVCDGFAVIAISSHSLVMQVINSHLRVRPIWLTPPSYKYTTRQQTKQSARCAADEPVWKEPKQSATEHTAQHRTLACNHSAPFIYLQGFRAAILNQ